jgi:hypothetical protein
MFPLRSLRLHAAALLLAAAPVYAATTTPVSNDTYLSSASPAAINGALQSVLVNSTNIGLLNFSYSLPSGTTSSQIAQATLTIYTNTVTTPGTFEVRRVTKPWLEAGANYNKNITYDSTSFGSFTPAAGKFTTIDVTSLLQFWLSNPGTLYGVALVSTGGDAQFDSKENTNTSHASTLDVTLVAGSSGPGYAGTSITPNSVGTGTLNFFTQVGLAYTPGSRARAISTANISNYVEGTVTAYDRNSGALTLAADTSNGSGTVNSWSFSLAGVPGIAGFQGPQGPQGTAGSVGPQGPSGPTGPQGATGAAGGAGLVKDGNGTTIGTLISFTNAGQVTFRTSTGYVVTAYLDGTFAYSQFGWPTAGCDTGNPSYISIGGSGQRRYDRFVSFSGKANAFYAPAVQSASTHIAITLAFPYLAFENSSTTAPAGYTCTAQTNNNFGYPAEKKTPTDLGLPQLTGTPLALPSPLQLPY